MRTVSILSFLFLFFSCNNKTPQQTTIDLKTNFERNPNETVTYEHGIKYWQLFDTAYDELSLAEYGWTDAGKPLTLAILSKEGISTVEELAESKKPLFFINNAIHAGEPCGVDATMMFYRDILETKEKREWLNDMNLVAITMYNIGGVLNRNSTTRTNQNGPKEYGFRGNAKNLDLNRDFIKSDSENAESFNQLFADLNPDVFIDNHTTNGADYQYVMTLIHSMPEHYEQPLRDLYEGNLIPYLFDGMENLDSPMTPYVNSTGSTPFEGIAQFNDKPRYSMGYASLFNTLAFTGEAHMLKPYEDRVWATYNLMNLIAAWTANNGKSLQQSRKEATEELLQNAEYTVQWQLDRENPVPFDFMGYEPKYKTSEVSGLERLYYDRNEPITKEISFYNKYKSKISIKKPKAYIIPQAYADVILKLGFNNIKMQRFGIPETYDVTAYQIVDYKSPQRPYENHFLHSSVLVDEVKMTKTFQPGDYIVYLDQPNQKYILETLEPQAEDSFFAWNYFDGVLQQKEYFSPYVFEDEAAELLRKNPEWRAELEAKKKEDQDFANSSWAQLYFVYKKSDRYEKTANIYPVYRVEW